MRSFLRWAGSKRLLLPKLRRYWRGDFGRYIEPFAGSACMFFDLEPEKAILGDLNWELVVTLKAVQMDVGLVLQSLRRLPRGKRHYYRIRSVDPTRLTAVELAARFLYLNRFCFNGLYRTNLRGKFNVPYCHPGASSKFDEELIREAARLLSRAELMHADFSVTTALAEKGDFVYLDPPYVVQKRRVFKEYLPGSFSANDLPRIASLLDLFENRGVRFLMTYADCSEARRLLRPWHPKRIWVRRNIAGFTGKRRGYYELLATNVTM